MHPIKTAIGLQKEVQTNEPRTFFMHHFSNVNHHHRHHHRAAVETVHWNVNCSKNPHCHSKVYAHCTRQCSDRVQAEKGWKHSHFISWCILWQNHRFQFRNEKAGFRYVECVNSNLSGFQFLDVIFLCRYEIFRLRSNSFGFNIVLFKYYIFIL